jgi:hypothetical protein
MITSLEVLRAYARQFTKAGYRTAELYNLAEVANEYTRENSAEWLYGDDYDRAYDLSYEKLVAAADRYHIPVMEYIGAVCYFSEFMCSDTPITDALRKITRVLGAFEELTGQALTEAAT